MIKVENLGRNYGDFKAVSSLNFEIPRGQIVGLLGHNGAGKTTTLKMLTGFLEPTTGSVKINGIDVSENPKKIQENLGYLPEMACRRRSGPAGACLGKLPVCHPWA